VNEVGYGAAAGARRGGGLTVDIREFLTARLAEDEAVAREASEKLTRRPHKGRGATWRVFLEGGGDGWAIESTDGEHSFIVGFPESLSTHIARHDPARVLRDVEADRHLVALALSRQADRDFEYGNDPRPADRIPELRILASRWSDHLDFDPTWSPDAMG
jgi:hypothetical protein